MCVYLSLTYMLIFSSVKFDNGCFVVGNIDNANPPSNKIAVGSLQGMLRIYHPSRAEFRVEDLLLEESLNAPILQLQLGQFLSSSAEHVGLAVLHPRKLRIFELTPQAQQSGRANYYALDQLYEHDLGMDGKHFTAFNMTSGGFGGVRGREMILVQSIDGKMKLLFLDFM